MSLSNPFLQRLNELYQSFIKFDATQCDRIKRYRNIEPESALFLAMQVRIQQSKKILEIGTSTGYSTLWLADAAKVTGAKVTTLEIDEKRTQQAQLHAQELQVDDVIDFWVGDAQKYLEQCQEQYDFILLDAERNAYLNYWIYLQKMLVEHGGVLIVDNVISHAAEVKSFIMEVKRDERFMTTTLSIGSGLFVVTFKN
ncbi:MULTISPECIES: O-methyltransferase [Acinetobacter]|jgi:predicted O-methyltransferase YrrM|uniref:O-methyltransferase n=1 Tax=Acinetobacter TaxID=469 RepID=UPI0004D92F7D|nr:MULTISPECIES: class I SAM-dependent methyltransferase [Acinetobacter]KEC85267.1 methyltransferase [Acinetobacter sp. ETR1]MCG7221575.1 class I SAM-dependent methyltransferase [Acinetobacter sp. AG3]MDO6643158.1 class I SAM-dependent methyltransferase [Acinetobacter guillouiae]WEE38185.1 class I SAM-dependent methyltransferase [Acinetobacter sp. TAC-1]BAP36301.1 O-methyltransferase [Acinetobacter guillouiae]